MESNHPSSGYFHPKRQRKPSYSSTSLIQNQYRKPSLKKTYIKKSKQLSYTLSDILSLQSHPLSQHPSDSPFLHRILFTSFNQSVPKLIKSDLDEITKLFKSLLNKLTPTNFEQIYLKIQPLLTPGTSKDLAALLLAKACQEIKYSETYAKLSKTLQINYEKFRDDLLAACQAIFESDSWERCENSNDKKKLMGLVAFIGELMNVRMLSTKVLLICCQYLLDKNNEVAAEGLCFLLSSFGEAFTGRYKELAHDMVSKLGLQAKGFVPRIQFLVTDLVESNRIQNTLFKTEERPKNLNSSIIKD
jgi:hypothetical protein